MSSSPPLIGALLRVPWEVVRARMLDGLHARGFDDLAPAHLNVLQYPGPDGARPSELAARLNMSKQALNYLLGQLEAAGYLQRRDEGGTRRVRLTGRGSAAMAAIRQVVGEVEREWEAELGEEAFAQLRALLAQLNVSVAARQAQ